MQYYIDITLLPDTDISADFLWHKVFQQVHIALAENKIGPNESAIAVGFPDYRQGDFPLGHRLRLFAQTKEEFEQLNIQRWLSRLIDYVHVKAVKPVPDGVQDYAYFKRWNYKSPQRLYKNLDRRAAAIASKNGYDEVEVKRRLLENIKTDDKRWSLPFIQVTSLSSQKRAGQPNTEFALYIERETTKQPPNKDQPFTCYGLSRREPDQQSAVPCF
ncbi:type I-F CRISPR-associated endoribonuclease Cas6/Csy4 [Salinivibrio kushneri]|uniref:type I-F CRISPR-associated endoribonuclease Cas6/Csy4 n=1 Tax=Salinivibrio kushneri TaxID=1908198 RepID=UPI000984F4C7|nr:type I-F CRISPR-associated endoribonuclease Cas6/Csy4 [Salinivibrio kushneri]OOE48330.1 type I-F CRISPR-associated endoribonuclease Cas6/Csy4 [Salinivibrio kushneri]OOE58098.1 type I-F CRISPR-associated endoribonuclease Cas6/Csy4 [Salinivibrio kushneri]